MGGWRGPIRCKFCWRCACSRRRGRAGRNPERRSPWLWLAGTLAALLYTHYAPGLAMIAAAVLYLLPVRRRGWLAASMVGALIVYAPLLAGFLNAASRWTNDVRPQRIGGVRARAQTRPWGRLVSCWGNARELAAVFGTRVCSGAAAVAAAAVPGPDRGGKNRGGGSAGLQRGGGCRVLRAPRLSQQGLRDPVLRKRRAHRGAARTPGSVRLVVDCCNAGLRALSWHLTPGLPIERPDGEKDLENLLRRVDADPPEQVWLLATATTSPQGSSMRNWSANSRGGIRRSAGVSGPIPPPSVL